VFLIRRDDTPSPEAEAWAGYVDRVLEGGDAAAPDQRLGDLVTTLRAELRPVEPSPEFLSGLRIRLVAAADQRFPAAVDEAVAAWRQPRFIIGAAGLVSAAAVIAFVARSRMMQPKAA
jgi:hypothetical protein